MDKEPTAAEVTAARMAAREAEAAFQMQQRGRSWVRHGSEAAGEDPANVYSLPLDALSPCENMSLVAHLLARLGAFEDLEETALAALLVPCDNWWTEIQQRLVHQELTVQQQILVLLGWVESMHQWYHQRVPNELHGDSMDIVLKLMVENLGKEPTPAHEDPHEEAFAPRAPGGDL